MKEEKNYLNKWNQKERENNSQENPRNKNKKTMHCNVAIGASDRINSPGARFAPIRLTDEEHFHLSIYFIIFPFLGKAAIVQVSFSKALNPFHVLIYTIT
jgi:hypothetical protein